MLNIISKKVATLCIVAIILVLVPLTIEHSPSHGAHSQNDHGHSHSHGHSHDAGHSHGGSSNFQTAATQFIEQLSHVLSREMNFYFKNYSKSQQSYLGALVVSAASLPIFLILFILRIHVFKVVLNVFTAFSAGALLGEVFVHSIPEMYGEPNTKNIPRELIICLGVSVFFIIDKILGLLTGEGGHGHSHGDDAKSQNIMLCLIGDFLHNVADGLAIGAAFNKNITLGVGMTVGIFLHEIPHEVGDFSYLLKQKLGLFNVFLVQVVTAGGAFFGVYLSTLFGETYSTHILCFACGSFLYLSINTILGELKSSSENDGLLEQLCYLFLEGASIILGVFFMTYFV